MLTRRVLVLVSCVFALWVMPAVAADGLSAGVVVGANIASADLTGTDASGISTAAKAGAYLGGFLLWPLNDVIGLEPEVAYSQKYFTVTDTPSGVSATEKWDWIEVPILARISVWYAGERRIYAIAGPGFGFRARAKEEAVGQTADVTNSVQRVDVSIIGGGGFAIGNAAVEVRYDGGVRDLSKNNGLSDNLYVKSRSMGIVLKWSFK